VKAKKGHKNIRKIADRNMVINEDITKQCKQHSLVKVRVLKQPSKGVQAYVASNC
jgi:RNA-binding protein YhbY